MKYEITKGSEKDFEGAPEWCLFIVGIPGFRDRVFVEDLLAGSRHQFIGSERVSQNSDLHEGKHHYIIAERRPITEQAWDGEYPIPAGINLEVHFESDDSRVWTEFRVEYMRGDVVVLYDYRSDNVESYSNARLSFRPIRSPEDVARDEAIKQMISILNEGTSTQDDARDIYDAIAAGKIPGVKLE